MKSLLFVLLAVVFPLVAEELPKNYEQDVSRWKVVPIPPRTDYVQHDVFTSRANISSIEWTVERQGNQVRAVLGTGQHETPAEMRPAFSMEMPVGSNPSTVPDYVLKVSDGWLAGYNRGEFGAALWWYDSDGKSRYKISDHQVNELLVHQDRVFAVEGLAHMGFDSGSLIEIEQKEGKWMASTFVELPGSGSAITVLDDSRFCVVTSMMLLTVSLDKKMEILVPYAAEWQFPHSLAFDPKTGNIYIGMRQYVARYNLKRNDHTFDFLIPSPEFINKKDSPGF